MGTDRWGRIDTSREPSLASLERTGGRGTGHGRDQRYDADCGARHAQSARSGLPPNADRPLRIACPAAKATFLWASHRRDPMKNEGSGALVVRLLQFGAPPIAP